MDDLIAFLRARLDEDEAAAMEAVFPSPWDVSDRGHYAAVRADEPDFRIITELDQSQGVPGVWLSETLSHIARHDPARVLADVAAKRAVVFWCEAAYRVVEADRYALDVERVLLHLASAYAEHPDYHEEWRP